MNKSLPSRIAQRIARSRRDVFLLGDFADLAPADQISRALGRLVLQGAVIRLGRGVYAKARPSSLSGRPVLANSNGFQAVAQQALTRLGIPWEPTKAQCAYIQGRTPQIPVNPVVRVKGRRVRHLQYGTRTLLFERGS